MARWLLKTEPGDYSWDRLVADRVAGWDGVRNHQAARNMRAMRRGERAFFYRSVQNPAVVTALAMPLTYSIATGIGFGFIAYAAIKLFSGRVRDVSPAVAALAVLFAIRFAMA